MWCGVASTALEAEAEESGRSLASELGSLLYAAEDAGNSTAGDVLLRAGGTELRAHRCVLIARSEYFRALFLGEFSEAMEASDGQRRSTEVALEDVEPRTMQDLLWCLYTGDAPDSADADGLVSLLGAAHRFGCEVVQIQCEALFVAGIDAEQVCDVLMLADHYSRPQLRAMALAFVVGHPTEVEQTDGW